MAGTGRGEREGAEEEFICGKHVQVEGESADEVAKIWRGNCNHSLAIPSVFFQVVCVCVCVCVKFVRVSEFVCIYIRMYVRV